MSDRSESEFPQRNLVEKRLEDLLHDRITREEAAAWAWPLVSEDHPRLTDIPAWDAVTSLSMCDGRHSSGDYMYDKVSFRAWLEQLRASAPKTQNQ